MRLVYRIEEGSQIRVRRVLLTGYRRTPFPGDRPRGKGKPDQPLREGEVVESQQKLYNLGIFNRVIVEPQNAGVRPREGCRCPSGRGQTLHHRVWRGFEVQRLASSTNPTEESWRQHRAGFLRFPSKI